VLTGEETTPQQTSYSYDFENRLNQLNYVNIPNITGTQADNFIYNGEGLRTQAVRNATTENYLYDGSNVLVRRNASGITTKSYTRGLDIGGGIGSLISENYTANNTAVTQFYDYNDLGSVADLTTATGTVASDYSYDSFGNLLTPQASGDTNRYLFSTKEFESRSGLEYFGARYYDPEVGRWLTSDPLGFVDGFNTYAYLGNNPVNEVDPFGLYGLEAPIFGPPLLPPPVNLGGKSNASGNGNTSQSLNGDVFSSTGDTSNTGSSGSSSGGSNSSNNQQFNDVANELGMDADTKNDFSDWLHSLKNKSGRGGSDNYGYQELKSLGQEFLGTSGK